MKQPPYTTKSGLRIGCCYQPAQRPQHDEDALRLQEALIASRSKHARARTNGWRSMQPKAFLQLRLRHLKLLLQRLLLRAQIGILKLKLRCAAAKVAHVRPVPRGSKESLNTSNDQPGDGGYRRQCFKDGDHGFWV